MRNNRCVFFLSSLLFASEALGTESAPIPFCGIATIQGAMRDLGMSLTAREIEQRVRELHPESDLAQLSLYQIETTIESYDYNAKSVVYDFENPGRIPTPAILYISPSNESKGIGHYVLLRHISEGNAFIEDLTSDEPTIIVPVVELPSLWNGAAIVFNKQLHNEGGSLPKLLIVSIVVFIISLIGLIRIRLIPHWQSGNCRTLIATLVCLLIGCENDDRPLTCSKPVIHLPAMAQGGEAVGCFELSAWRKSEVRILGVTKSCECVATSNGKLIGTVIAPGSSETVCLTVPTHGRSGLVEGMIVLDTKPSQSPPLALKVRVNVEGRPTLVTTPPLRFRVTPADQSPPSVVRISLSRVPDGPKLELDVKKCDFKGLSLLDSTVKSTEAGPSGGQYQSNLSDLLKLTLSAPSDFQEEDSGVVKLAFAGRDEVISVPFEIVVSHPLALELSSLYVHEIKAGEIKTLEVGFLQRPVRKGASSLLVTPSVDWIKGTVSPTLSGIDIELRAPEALGRHEGKLNVSAVGQEDDHASSLDFPVAINVVE